MTFGVSGGFSNIVSNSLTLSTGTNQTVYTCPVGAIAYVNMISYTSLSSTTDFYFNYWDKVNSSYTTAAPTQINGFGSSFLAFSAPVSVLSASVPTLLANGKVTDPIYVGTTWYCSNILRLNEGDKITVNVSGSAKITVNIAEQTAA